MTVPIFFFGCTYHNSISLNPNQAVSPRSVKVLAARRLQNHGMLTVVPGIGMIADVDRAV